jgi:hypothetical protein
MEENRNKPQEQQSGEKNPTLDSPGSKVADYGNTTGGTANDELEQKHGMSSSRQGNSSIPSDEDETAGIP